MLDVVIVGSGPAGIYAGYLAKMHNLNFKIIEASSEIGGQMLLFKDKPVYDMPGQNNVDGKGVLSSLVKQFNLTNEKIHLNEKLLSVKGKYPNFNIKTTVSTMKTKCVIFASGGGFFEPMKLGINNENIYKNINYSVENLDQYKDKKLIIFGGGDSAVDWAHFLQNICKEVILIHRRDQFRAQEKLLNELKKTIKIFTPFKLIDIIDKDNNISKVKLTNVKTKENKTIECDEVLVFFGQKKVVNKEDTYGIKMNNTSFVVESNMETNREGIFAIGNVSHYKGKIKVLATAFGEASTAIGSVVYKIFPGKKMTYVK